MLDTQRTGTPDLRVTTASCPETLDLSVGSRFECTVEVEGVKAPYNVSLPSPGVIEAVPARTIISTASAVGFVRTNLPPEVSTRVEVDCGRAPVRVVDVGATFPCSISDGRSTQTVNVLAQDSKGAVSLQL